nr:hypothetical protein [Tanacetum cinerariifolium]
KLLKDLKELAEYDQSTSTDRPIFLNNNEDRPVQNKESLENSSEENVVSKTNQEPPQDSDIHRLIEECSVEVPERQKQKMEDTIALDSKLLSINSINSQRLDKKEQEVKIVEEQPAERRNLAPIQSTKEPEHLLSMGYEHLSITPETKLDEVTESNAENLLPIPSKCEEDDDFDSSDDESLPDEDVLAEEFKIYSNPLCDEDEINSDKLDPHCFNVESDFVESLLRDTFIDFSSKFDFSGELAYIKPEIPKSNFDFEEEIRLIENLLYDNSFPRPPKELNAEIANTIIESTPLLPIPAQDGIENVVDDPEGDIRFLEELLIDDSILSDELSDSVFEDNPSNSRPPPEPPDDNFDLEPEAISAVMEDIDEPDEHFNLGGEIFVSTNNEDVDYFPFMFVIRIFLPYLILSEISRLLLSAESEDTIFNPGLSSMVEAFLCWICVRFPRPSLSVHNREKQEMIELEVYMLVEEKWFSFKAH